MSKRLQEQVQQSRQWKRMHPSYPLTVHTGGQWVKKVYGRTYYFGPLDDPDAALKQWLREKDYLLAGEPPPNYQAGITIKQLLDEHLQDVDERIAADKLAPKTRRDYLVVGKLFDCSGLINMPVKALRPQHFATLQKTLEQSGRRPRTQQNVIGAVKTVFNWGRRMELFDCRIRYGPRFVAPSLIAIEAEQEENSECRFLDRELLLVALKNAKPNLKVAIFLGINCGFYPGDSIAFPLDRLHLNVDIPYHDFRRVKTRQRRMAALWPETVEAIQEYRQNHRKPIDPSERRLLLSQLQRPYSTRHNGHKLADSFNHLLDGLGDRPPGVSLGSLRHTYGTVVDLVPDQAMIDLTMGHTNKAIQKRTYSQLNLRELERLQAVAEVVREWLFGGGEGTFNVSQLTSTGF
jgi:integrase